ncbi:helix-turn-helix domain-containing protein [Pectobacterium versatile]|uniref:helix-turn-helix domain-containing protein n=1 Tax=Pectobacterium versatile TaxID=2488639 RepID=UPI0037FDAF6A
MFVMAARSGSLAVVARENNILLPTLSRRIQDLEKEIKVLLLERTAKGCRVTEAGQSRL